MSRYNKYDELDDVCSTDGDARFVGIKSLRSPEALESGYVSYAANMRFDRNTAKPRKGCVSQSLGVQLKNPPLILPFVLDDETTFLYNDYNDGARCAGTYFGDEYVAATLDFQNGELIEPAEVSRRGRVFELNVSNVFAKKDYTEYLVEVFSDKIYFFNANDNQLERVLDIPDTETIPNNSNICILQAVNRLIIFRGRDADGNYLRPLFWEPTMDEFEPVPDAKAYYSMPFSEFGLFAENRIFTPLSYQKIDIVSISCKNGIATAETTIDHGLRVGDKITIYGANFDALNGTWTVSAATESVWDEEKEEYTTKPSFSYDTSTGETFTDDGAPEARYDTRDEYVVSGLLEPFEYDLVNGHFRPEMGTNNYIVGFCHYQKNSVLVFFRNSIYLHSGLDSLRTSTISLITREVGCVARNTICPIGRSIYFLSDEGVYSLQIDTGELSLIGSGEPLSKEIDDLMKRINISAAGRACGVYCDHRYYLGVPIDCAKRNNAVFVYNMVNKAWESVDTYPSSLSFDYLLSAICGGQKRVFACSREGGVVLLEEREDGDECGMIDSDHYEVAAVNGYVRTRAYFSDTPEIKKFNRIQASVNAADGERFSLAAKIEDPDTELPEKIYDSDGSTESVVRRAVRARAHRLQVEYRTYAGRPELKRVAVDASIPSSDNRRV